MPTMKPILTLSVLSLLALNGLAVHAQSAGSMPAAAVSLSSARGPVPSPASAYPVAPAPGLFDALGGTAGIRSLMDDFVARLKADPRLASAFQDTKPAHLAGQLSDQVCQLAGGPCVYQGPDMKDAHRNMDVTRADFNALVEVLQHSMDACGLPFARQNQLLALLAPMHRDVVNAP